MLDRASGVVKGERRSLCGTGVRALAVAAAVGCAFAASADISASAYVQRGLVAQWDGIEKAEDVAADGWTDLKGGVTLGPRIPDGGSIVTGTKYVRLSGACLYIDSTTDAAAIAANKAFAGAQKTVEIAGNGEGPTDTKWVSALEVVPTTAQKRIFLWYNGGNGVELDTLLLKGEKFPRTGLQLVNNTDFTAALAFTTVKDFIPYQDGVAKRPVIADNVGASDPTEAHITLGSWDSVTDPQTGTKMEFHALRVYNVTLTPEEVRYNAWLDRVRFSNEELPEGLFVTEEGALEAEVTVTFDETQGCVSNKGVAVQSGATIRIPFIPGSGSALLTAEPKEGFCITGVRGESAVVDRVNGTIAVDMLSGYLADGSAMPSELEVTFGNAREHVSEGAYVQRGLVVHYEGSAALRWGLLANLGSAGDSFDLTAITPSQDKVADGWIHTETGWRMPAQAAAPIAPADGYTVEYYGKQTGDGSTAATYLYAVGSSLTDASNGTGENAPFRIGSKGKDEKGMCIAATTATWNSNANSLQTAKGTLNSSEPATRTGTIDVGTKEIAYYENGAFIDSAKERAGSVNEGIKRVNLGDLRPKRGCYWIGDLGSVRIYDEKLTPDEVRYNAWIDDVRFSGGEVPDGVIVTKAGLLEIKLKVLFDGTRGSVSVGGAAIQSGDEVTFVIVDGAVHLSATPADGFAIKDVEGAPADIDRTEGAIAVNVLSGYLADGSAVPSALEVKFVKPSPAVSEKSYVRRGLAAQWDGIVKGENVPEDGWTDLVGGVTLKAEEGRESGITTDAKSVFVDSVRFYDASAEATALVKTIAAHNSTVEVAAKMPDETSAHMIFSAVTPANGGGLDERVLLWYCEAAASNKRRYYYIKTGSGYAFENTGLPAVGEARFTESLTLSTDKFTCFRNGALAYSRAVALPACTVTDGCLALNCISSSRDPSAGKMTYNGVRIYGAYLSAAEQLVNSNIDKVRFDGADPTALMWPEGFRCVVDWLEARVTVTYDETQGTFLDANGDPVRSGVATWVPADGAEVKLTLDADEGMVVASVDGVPAVVDYANDVITLSATGNVTCAADIARRGPAIDVNSYVQRGLVAQWDGIVKDADVAANGWTDLRGGVTFRRMADTGSVVTDDKYVRVDGEALWDNGDGAANVVRTVSKPGVTFEVVAKTSATTPFVFSAAKEEENTADSNRILLWYNGARTMYHASGTYPGFWTTGITPTKGVRNTEVLRYPLPSTAEFLLNGEFKGKKADLSSMTPYTGETGSVYLSALCRSNGVKDGPIDYYGIRVYDATLTDKEIKFNSDLDKVRFDGDDPAKIAWPEGVRYRGNWLEAQVTVAYDETRGTVFANGQPVASNVTTWVAIDGGAVKLTLVDVARGMGMTAVEGAPADVDLKKGEAVLIPFGRPSVTVRIEPLIASEVMYVQRGLVAHWDGVKKAADVATDGWTDLKAGVTLGPRIPDGGSIVTDAKGVNLHGASLYIDSATDAAAIAVARAFAGAQKTIEIAGNGEGAKEDKWVSVLTGKDPSAGTYLFLWYNGGNGGVALDTLLLRGASGKFPRTGLRLVNNTDFTAALAFTQVGTFTPYQGGVAMSPELATAVELVTPNEAHINLGAFGSGKDPQTGTKMEFHALRVYNVTLTQTEVAFNAAVDQVRFSNVSPADADWPAGISYNAEKGELEVEVTVTYGEVLGTMTVNGISVKSGVPTKVPYNMGIATVVFAPAGEFVSLKSISAGGKKIPATDNQVTIDDFLHVRTIRAKISGGGMRLIVR